MKNESKSYRDVMFELIAYKYLEDDWDGYDGTPVPKKMLDCAWKFLGILIQNKICTPKIMVSGSYIRKVFRKRGSYFGGFWKLY